MRLGRYRDVWLDGAGGNTDSSQWEVLMDLGFSLLVLLHGATTLEIGCSQHNETVCSPSRLGQPIRGRDVQLAWPTRPPHTPCLWEMGL